MAEKILRCQFCEISFDIKWHCETCSLSMCDTCCTNIHSKIKNLHDHIIQRVSTESKENYNLEESKQVKLNQVRCSTHRENTCLLFCQNCDKSVCASCVIQPNQRKELAKIFDIRKSKLVEMKTSIDQSYQLFYENTTRYTAIGSMLFEQYNEIKEKIEEKKRNKY